MTQDARTAAGAISDEAEATIRRMHVPRVLHGTVTSLGWSSSPPVVTFTEPVPPGMMTQGRPNIRFLAPYQPNVGDVVIAFAVGDDLWVVGALSSDTGPVTVFPNGGGTGSEIEFASTWTNWGSPYQDVEYRVVGNEVIWSGLAAQSSGTIGTAQIVQAHGTTLLPSDLCPSANRVLSARADLGGTDYSVRITVTSGGGFYVQNPPSNVEAVYLSLDGVRWYLDQ